MLESSDHPPLPQVRLETLIDGLSDGVVVADRSGNILRVNAAVERILGWQAAELAGQKVDVLLSQGGAEAVALHREGHNVPVDILLGILPGAEDEVLVVIRDTTEGRAARHAAALLPAIVNSTHESVIGTDLNGVILSWNRGAEKLFGYCEAEALGKHLVLTYPAERQNECVALLKKAAQREPQPRHESRRIRKDGSAFDVSEITSPIEDAAGTVLGMSSICHDITERSRAAAAIGEAKRAAEGASHSKSEFLANMSHELRTPLNGILGLTEVLLDSGLAGESREYLTAIRDSADSLLMTMNDILDVAKIQAGKYILQPRQFWIQDWMAATMRDFEAAAARKKLKLTWSVDVAVPPVILGDSACLRQVLTNLIGNAIKFTGAGEVEVTLKTPPQDSAMLTWCVRDTGTGIPPEQQRIIFEPYTQVSNPLRRQFGGTGLGLAICAQLSDIMGGRLWVESDGKTGSAFHFTVRMAAVKAAARIRKAEMEEEIPSDRRRAPRVDLNEPAEMRQLRPFAQPFFHVRVVNLSGSGMRVHSGQFFDPGTLVQVSFKETVSVGEVRYCLPAGGRFHVGIQFISG